MAFANVKSSWKSGNLVFEKYLATDNPQIEFGITATGLDVKFYGDTSGSYMLWDESNDKLTIVNAPIEIAVTSTAAGEYGIKIDNTFTYTTTGNHKGINSIVTYDPATTGYGSPVAIAAKVSIAAGKQLTGGTAYMWGVQAQLDFGTSAVINNASSVVAAIRGVLTGTTPVFTDAEGVSCLYLDNLINTDITGMSSGKGAFIFCQNSGQDMDCVLRVWGPRVTNLLYLESCTNAIGNPGGPMVQPAATTSGSSYKIQIDIDGTTCYLNAYTGS